MNLRDRWRETGENLAAALSWYGVFISHGGCNKLLSLLRFWRPEVQNESYGTKIKVLAGWFFLFFLSFFSNQEIKFRNI